MVGGDSEGMLGDRLSWVVIKGRVIPLYGQKKRGTEGGKGRGWNRPDCIHKKKLSSMSWEVRSLKMTHSFMRGKKGKKAWERKKDIKKGIRIS